MEWSRLYRKLEKSFERGTRVRMLNYARSRCVHPSPNRIIHKRAATALILEDDVDWDVRLKEQVSKVLTAVQSAEFVRDWECVLPTRVKEGS
jgi:hypothetical protein